MILKEGMSVKLKSKLKLKKEFGLNDIGTIQMRCGYADGMDNFFGKIVTIFSVTEDREGIIFRIENDPNDYCYPIEIIEGVDFDNTVVTASITSGHSLVEDYEITYSKKKGALLLITNNFSTNYKFASKKGNKLKVVSLDGNMTFKINYKIENVSVVKKTHNSIEVKFDIIKNKK